MARAPVVAKAWGVQKDCEGLGDELSRTAGARGWVARVPAGAWLGATQGGWERARLGPAGPRELNSSQLHPLARE